MNHTLDASLGLGDRVLKRWIADQQAPQAQVEKAAFLVLKSPDIPSILVETGFHLQPRGGAPAAHRRLPAEDGAGHPQGVTSWFMEHPPSDTLLAWQKQAGGIASTSSARGDTLSEIAQRFNVTVASLRAHNSLSSNTIRIGQKLIIPTS